MDQDFVAEFLQAKSLLTDLSMETAKMNIKKKNPTGNIPKLLSIKVFYLYFAQE